MSIIVHASINNGWNKLDRKVFLIQGLSDGACRLYGYLIGLKAADNFSDTFIMKGLDISQDTLTRRKRELKKEDLIKSVKIANRTYMLFTGNTKMPASMVHSLWVKRQDNTDD